MVTSNIVSRDQEGQIQRILVIIEARHRVELVMKEERRRRRQYIREQLAAAGLFMTQRDLIIKKIILRLRRDQKIVDEAPPQNLPKMAEVEYQKLQQHLFEAEDFHMNLKKTINKLTHKVVKEQPIENAATYQEAAEKISAEITGFFSENQVFAEVVPEGSAVKGTLLVQRKRPADFDFLIAIRDKNSQERIFEVLNAYLQKNWKGVTHPVVQKNSIAAEIHAIAKFGRHGDRSEIYVSDEQDEQKKEDVFERVLNACAFHFRLVYDPDRLVSPLKISDMQMAETMKKLKKFEAAKHEQAIRIILFLKIWLRRNHAYPNNQSCFGGNAMEMLILKHNGDMVRILNELIVQAHQGAKETEKESGIELAAPSGINESGLEPPSPMPIHFDLPPLDDVEKLNKHHLFKDMNHVSYLLTIRAFFLLIIDAFRDIRDNLSPESEMFMERRATRSRPVWNERRESSEGSLELRMKAYAKRINVEIRGINHFLEILNRIMVLSTKANLKGREEHRQNIKKNAQQRIRQELSASIEKKVGILSWETIERK